MNEEDVLYKKQYELWLREQKIQIEGLEKSIKDLVEMLELNKQQLKIQKQRFAIGKTSLEDCTAQVEGGETNENRCQRHDCSQ